MKNRFQSIVDRAMLAGRRLSDPLTTHESPTNHPLKRSVWSVVMMVVFLFTLGIGQMWAAVTTEVYDASGASSGQAMAKTGSTLAGTYIAGQGGGAISGYSPSNKGVKLRTQTTKVTVSSTQYGYAVITANSGYVLKSFKLAGTSNGSNSIDLLGVYVDVDATSATTLATAIASATNQLSSTVTIPNKNTTYVSSPELSINASSNIVMLFPSSGDNQMRAIITIGYEEVSSGPVDPTASFSDGDYTIGGSDLDLSSLFTTNSEGDVTYTITNQGTTDAALRADGKSLYATTAGSVTVKVEQEATSSYNSFEATATITVSDFVAITSIALDYDEQHIYVGDVITITPTILPANASNKTLLWSVTEGATITQAGVLTAVAQSDVIVTAAAQDGSDVEGTSHIYIDALPTCATLTPAESGSAIAAGDAIDLQESAPNASIKALTANLSYTANGLLFGSSSSTKVEVTLNNLMKVGTVIRATVYNDSDDKARGLNLLNSAGTSKATWTKTMVGDHVETYTVVAGDGLAGSNVFQLQRNQNAYLKDISIANCGAELFALTSAIYPVEADGKATITLSKNLVEAGGTATATYSAIDAAYDFDEWVINGTGASISSASANPVTITMGSEPATITLKLKAAEVKHTVTYYDGETELGTELVVEGENPTATGIAAPKKIGYTFAGWSITNGGDATALSGISVAADMPLYAVYNAVNCSTLSGTIFSLILNNAPAANCTIKNASGFDQEADLIKYGTVSGGIALAKNSSSNNHIVITTDPKLRLLGGSGKVHIQFDCALKEGDKIRTTIENQNISYTTTDVRSTTNNFVKGTAKEVTITKDHVLENATEIYLWSASSSDGRLISLEVIRPEKLAVTFNMHGHGDAVDPQSVVEGGKVTEPDPAPTASGWDFGGWFTDDTYGTIWDFENMTISAATEIHAQWTEHVLSSDATLKDLTVNGVTVAGFDPATEEYNVVLEMGTTTTPEVAGVPNDDNYSDLVYMQTSDPTDDVTVTVTAENGSTSKTYTIHFSIATSKDINLVWATGTAPCKGTPDMSTQIKSNNAAVSTYINQISFTNVEGSGADGAEGTSLNVGKKAGNMFTLTAKPGYALAQMHFLAKIEDATCEYSIDGSDWTELASANTDGNECYAPFSGTEVHEFRLRSTGTSGVWIRNMQLNIVEACTPVVVTWDEEPVEFEVGKAGQVIAATANTGGDVAYSSNAPLVIAVDAVNGLLSVGELGSATLSASTAEGDGTTYCENSGNDIVINKVVNTYFLVKFNAQNGDDVTEVKFYSGDAEIALPAAPSYPGYDFQGWFDAAEGGNQYVEDITPAASITVYAQWQAQCPGATITTQPTSASYLTGRAATALVCEATAGNNGTLSYEWFTCEDDQKTNPVAATNMPSTAVAGTFYYFCKVMEAGCDVEAYSDVVTITVADKDPICLAWVDVTGQNAASLNASKSLYAPSVSAAGIKNSSTYDTKTGWKFNSSPGYVAIEGAPFKSGDIVEMFVTTVTADKARVFNANEAIAANVVAEGAANMVQGANKVVLTADANNLYLRRGDDFGGWNPFVAYIAVNRVCAPILNKVTVVGVDGTPDNTNHIAIEVPFSTTDDALDAIVYDWVSNNDAWTAAHAPAVANTWEWGVENTVTFADKDGDESVYYITISKAVASTNIELATLTVNGNAVTVVPGQYTYAYELPYGTSAVPAVVATAEDANANVGAVTADINSATFTVTAEDGTTAQLYTINFSVSKWNEVVIWDGSTMTAVATSPDATTGFAWAVTGFSSITNYNATCGTKAYTKTLPSGGSASASRNVAFTVPAGYVAKFYIAFGTHSDGNNRGMFIGSNATKTLDATSVLTLYSDSRTNLTDGTSEIVGAGTYYLNPMESEDFYEIRAYLRKGMVRNSMLGNGVFGTSCVDHNVAIEDIQGATFYELMGREPQYGKLAFDEIVSGELEAGAPYVFQAHGDKLILFYGETKVDDPVDKGNGMYGTFETVVLTELNDVYYFAQKALWSCDGAADLTVAANRAYVKLSEVSYMNPNQQNQAPGRRRVLMNVNGEKVATGIENLNASEKPMKLMINGQIFILRGEKMFDATGRLVK